jgi:hypothetical protein
MPRFAEGMFHNSGNKTVLFPVSIAWNDRNSTAIAGFLKATVTPEVELRFLGM